MIEDEESVGDDIHHNYPIDIPDDTGNTVSMLSHDQDALQKYRREREETRKRLLALDTIIRGLEALNGKSAAKGKGAKKEPTVTNPEAIAAVLSRASQPLSVPAILQALEKAGRSVRTTKPYRTVYNALRKDGQRFEKVGTSWRLRATAR